MVEPDGRGHETDPRSVRSREALSRAVLELAAEGPVTQLTITDLCARAGVTRRTFYNHSSSPTALLRQVLTSELDRIGEQMREDTASPNVDLDRAVRRSFGGMIDHVRSHKAVYRDTESGRIHPDLYTLLSDHFIEALRHSVETSARRIPVIDGVTQQSRRYPASVELHVSYIAHAYAGVIETTLRNPDITTEFALDVVIASLPGWMLSKTDTDTQPG